MRDPRREARGKNSPANRPEQKPPKPTNRFRRVERNPLVMQCVQCGRWFTHTRFGYDHGMNRNFPRSRGKKFGGKPGVSVAHPSGFGRRLNRQSASGWVCKDVKDCRRARRRGHRYQTPKHEDD